MGDTVVMVKGDVRTEVPTSEAGPLAASGFHPETEGENIAHSQTLADKETYGGIRGAVATGVAGAASGISGGLSDAGIAALGGGETLRGLRDENPTINTVSQIGGAVGGALLGNEGALAYSAPSLFAKAGKAVEAIGEGSGLLGQLGAHVAGSAVEGGLYGLGNGVAELATSQEPITAEHVTSTLSSNFLLGAGIGGITGGVFKAGEKALGKASEALTAAADAKQAIADIPNDLPGDLAGLRDAHLAERGSIAADKAAEESSLEELKVPKREQLANDFDDYRTSVRDDSQIYMATKDADAKAVAGVPLLSKQIRDVDFAMDRTLAKGPVSVAANTKTILDQLQTQEHLLTQLDSKSGELKAVFAGDESGTRSAALDNIPDVLARNRELQAAIKEIHAPIQSQRLTELSLGGSPKLRAIEAAQEALKNAPDKGLMQKGLESVAFTGGTALAHMIPGVGVLAPYAGKYAQELVGKAFEHVAGAHAAVLSKSAEAVSGFLNTAEKAAKYVPVVATKVLGDVRFGKTPPGTPEPSNGPNRLAELFKARQAELAQQTTYDPNGNVVIRPEVRQDIAARLKALGVVNPMLADQVETNAVRKIEYLSQVMPRRPDIGGMQVGPDKWQPSELEIRSWARTIAAVENPNGVEERLIHGNVTPEDAQAYRNVFPEKFKALQMEITSKLPTLSKTLPLNRQIALSVFTGIPVTPALMPNILHVLQSSFSNSPNGGTSAEMPKPNFGAFGSISKSIEAPTPSQARDAK